MRISFCYPPFSKNGHFPTLPQNRQFVYTASPEVKLYPVVLATAATWLAKLGHKVLWLDGITRRLSWKEYKEKLASFSPDIIVLEGKTPIMKPLWEYIDKLKAANNKLKVVLIGDHPTLFPKESFRCIAPPPETIKTCLTPYFSAKYFTT